MAKLFIKNQDTARPVEATYADPKDAVQELLVRAKKNARSNAKDRVQKTFTKAKGTVQHKLADTKDFTQSTLKTARNTTQDRLAKVQRSTKVWLNKVLNLLLAGMSLIVALFYKIQRQAQKKLKQAQASLAKTTTPTVEKTQAAVVTSTKKASKSLQKAAANAKESLQDRYVHYQRKRRRNRMLFRLGLLSGVVLALFSTPLAGSKVRKYIIQRWQQYRSHFKS